MTDSPAKTFANSLGAGWYIPSIDELVLLWHNRYLVNRALSNNGSELLAMSSIYWTSNEYSTTNAFGISFYNCDINDTYSKISPYSVRAIRTF